MSNKVAKVISSIGENITASLERGREREREFVSDDQFHAQNYREAAVLMHLRNFTHSKYHCALCQYENKQTW